MIFTLFAISLGCLIGGGIIWVNSYSENVLITDQHELLEAIFSNSETIITDANYSCEGKPVRTVGAVVASLLELNTTRKRNVLSYGCYESVCTMSVSNCKPWQESECGSRFLKFNINKKGNIDATTFSCFDMP